MKKSLNTLIGAVSLSLLVSCASNIKKVDLPPDIKPADAISQTEQMQEQARQHQADVLAYDDFQKGHEYLEEAKEALTEDENAKESIESAAYAQAYFQQSIANASKHDTSYLNILDARAAAVSTGVLNYERSHEIFAEVDADFRDESDEFTANLSPDMTSELQKRYLDLEVWSVQENELGRAERVQNLMRDKYAARLAPETFKKAQEDLFLAKNIIGKSPRDPNVYRESVMTALRSTVLLQDVMNVISENGLKTPESAALKIVRQNRKIERVEERVAALGSTVLRQADTIAFQRVMESVGKEFSKDEAEVYQQGDKLIIRLKKINFPVGKARIPQNSEALLTKVNMIVRGLNPSQVEVQGHTDSTGSKAINEHLSQKRAENVAVFLKGQGLPGTIEAKGYGPNKPLADNQTRDGRAINRRVDIVISTEPSGQVYSE